MEETVFAKDLFSQESIDFLKNKYSSSQPYRHAVLPQLFDHDFLLKARQEIFRATFTEKETDIYKINQTGDLGNIHLLPEDERQELSTLLQLRNSLYSSQFRQFLRDVTGCGPLSGVKADMSCANYSLGSHLLNHDDVIGTRRLSFILYLPLPEPAWKPEYGGALELYPLAQPPTDPTTPAPKPSVSIPPSFNQFTFFEVQPGHSFHSVEEVVIKANNVNDEQGGFGQRISISGWFHAPVEQEPEYQGPPGKIPVSSLQQLYATALKPLSPYTSDPPMPLPEVLDQEEIKTLSSVINPAYLKPKTLRLIRSKFVQESHVELADFLNKDVAQQLLSLIQKRDKSDKLTLQDRVSSTDNAKLYKIPPHDTGDRKPWKLTGPPHIQRFLCLNEDNESYTQNDPLDELLCKISSAFKTEAFRSLLAVITNVAPLAYTLESRRFRPGLDYTLARGDPQDEPKLDVCLNLTPNDDDLKPKDLVHPFSSGQVGAWDVWLVSDPDSDEATYGATSRDKGKAVDQGEEEVEDEEKQDEDDKEEDDENDEDDEDENENENDEEDEDDEDDEPLLTLPPQYNRLHIVLRDAGVLRFVKYLSSLAPHSRWDISGEWDVGQLEEEEEEE